MITISLSIRLAVPSWDVWGSAPQHGVHVRPERLSAPLPLLRRLGSQSPRLRQAIGDSGRDECSSGRVAGADVTPTPVDDGVGNLSMAHVMGAFGAECRVRRRVGTRLREYVAPVAKGVGSGP